MATPDWAKSLKTHAIWEFSERAQQWDDVNRYPYGYGILKSKMATSGFGKPLKTLKTWILSERA